MSIKDRTLIIILLCIFANCINADENKSLYYAGAKLKLLPLLQFRSDLIIHDNIIFLHPPKVAGTNVVNLIDAIKTIKSKRFAVPRIKGKSPGLITKGWVGGLASIKLDCMNTNKCDEYKFISGHFPYGAHKYLNKKYTYISLIRNPIERELSSVNFDYQRGYISGREEAIKYLLETMIDNPQTRMIAGEKYMLGICDEKVLEIAKRNLKHKFLLTGVTEDVDIFIQTLISILKLEPVGMVKSQVTAKKILPEISREIKDRLVHKHKFDIALYEYAKDNWNKWKQDNIVGPEPIDKKLKILTILPEYISTHRASYMSYEEIEQYNSSYSENSLIQFQQNHHGVPK